jgi:hypothetical protein
MTYLSVLVSKEQNRIVRKTTVEQDSRDRRKSRKVLLRVVRE